MKTKKITLNELRSLIQKTIKENNSNYQGFGKEDEDAYNIIMDRYDGPVDEFVVISRAMKLVSNAGPSKASMYANVLKDALDTLRENGGSLESLEY